MEKIFTICVRANSNEDWNKAIQIAASSKEWEINSLSKDKVKSQLVLIGKGIDSYALIECLNKKFKGADYDTIVEVKPPEQKDERNKIIFSPKKIFTISVAQDSCWTKAKQIVASFPGVMSFASDANKKQLVVTGVEINSFALMRCLKTGKVRCADYVSIEKMSLQLLPPEKKDDKKEEKKKDEKKEEEKEKKDNKKEEKKKDENKEEEKQKKDNKKEEKKKDEKKEEEKEKKDNKKEEKKKDEKKEEEKENKDDKEMRKKKDERKVEEKEKKYSKPVIVNNYLLKKKEEEKEKKEEKKYSKVVIVNNYY